jgi:hypothetical protein
LEALDWSLGNNRIQCDSEATRHATGQHGSKQNTEGLVHRDVAASIGFL